LAKAQAIDAQVKAYGGAEYRVIQEVTDKLSDAIKSAKVDIVPKTVVNMGGGDKDGAGSSSTILDTLLRFVTMEKLGVKLTENAESSLQLVAPTVENSAEVAATHIQENDVKE